MNLSPFTYEVNALPVELESQLVAPVGHDPTIPKASDFKSDVYSNSTKEPFKLAVSRGIEPHPISENPVFKAGRRTIPAALLTI